MRLMSRLSDRFRALILLPFLMTATPAFAQSAQVPTLPSASVSVDATTAQSVNNAVSYGTVGANVLFDVIHDLQAPNKSCALKQEALKVGFAVGISEVLKLVIHRQRPDLSDYKDFPSEHTAIAFASSGWSVSWGYSFAIGTGVERHTADRHDWVGVLGGVAVGEGSKWLGAKILPCSA